MYATAWISTGAWFMRIALPSNGDAPTTSQIESYKYFEATNRVFSKDMRVISVNVFYVLAKIEDTGIPIFIEATIGLGTISYKRMILTTV